MSSKSFNILKKQKEQVKCMLNLQCEALNSTSNDTEHIDEPWKIIVYDNYCRNIIVPLFSVQELQSFGITLYLLINHKRQKIPNVPAIYFIKPTQTNLDIIANDMQSVLYDTFYLNFSLNLQRKNLEYLANKLIQSNSFHRLTKIYDQYINYTSLSPNLFTLNISNCYQQLNTPSSSDESIQQILNEIVESLFCVIATLETIPIIRAQKGGAAQRIAELLSTKISIHLKNRSSNLFEMSGMSIYQNRPILILLERSIDFAMPLHHSPIYESLIDDLLGLKSNHVHINDKEQIFLDYEHDEFWRQNALEPLPKVHEYHTSMLTWYQCKKDEIENKHNVSTTPSVESETDEKGQNESQHDLLKSTIKSMPELLKKKDEIDRHNKLMTAVSEVLSDRAISEYFHLEEALMHSTILSSEQNTTLKDMLGIDAKGIVEDKCRLFLIYYLCHHDVKRQTLNDLIDILMSNDNLDEYLRNDNDNRNRLAALQYVIDHKKLLNLGESWTDNDEQKVNDTSGSTRMSSWWESGQSILNKVKGMLPTSGKCTVTRIAKLLMNTDSTSLANVAYSSVNTLKHQSNPHLQNVNKNYVTFDPIDSNGRNMDKVNFQEYERGIVFVVGGGCFAEYANLNEFANTKHKNIIYGCTDIVSPNDFLTQLTKLGQK